MSPYGRLGHSHLGMGMAAHSHSNSHHGSHEMLPSTSGEPSFNQLQVALPDVPLMRSPLVTGAKQLWRDTSELLAPIGRLGLPHATLQTKCPHYDQDLWSKPGGDLLMDRELRKVVKGAMSGVMYQENHKHVPHACPPMPEPAPLRFIVASNMLCYWALTAKATRARTV